jgi:hypothetical protein
MKNFIIPFLALISFQLCLSQTEIPREQTQPEVDFFKKNKITEYFFISTICHSDIYTAKNETNCDKDNEQLFVFWEENETFFYRRIDRCTSTKYVLPERIFSIFKNQKKIFTLETVKPYQLETYSSDLGKTFYSDVTIDHSCISTFQFWHDGYIYIKTFNWFDLTNNKEESENANYTMNNNLKFIQLVKMCKEITFPKK